MGSLSCFGINKQMRNWVGDDWVLDRLDWPGLNFRHERQNTLLLLLLFDVGMSN